MRQGLSRNYKEFTPDERMRLTLAAAARKDHDEAIRLMTTCPQRTFVGADPEYSTRLLSVGCVTANVLLCWVDVSHLVIRFGTELRMLDFLATAYGSEVDGVAQGDTTKSTGRAIAAKVKAQYKIWSAMWKGIESGIARFCTEADLTVDQLFALKGPLSPAIEEARGILAPDVAAKRAVIRGIHDQLSQAWWGNSKPS